jgi:hypothetical protein
MEDTTPVRLCGCGCGAEVARRYLPGHDARHKAALVLATNTAPNRHLADRAIDALIEAGWVGYADLAVLRGYVQRDRGKAKAHIAEVGTWLVGPNGQHHSRHACRTLTASARVAGHLHPITKLASQAAIQRTTEPPVGWDICQQCTYENTLDEHTEHYEVGKRIVLACYDELGLTKLGNAKAKPKAKAAPKATKEPKPFIRLADVQWIEPVRSSDQQVRRHLNRPASSGRFHRG